MSIKKNKAISFLSHKSLFLFLILNANFVKPAEKYNLIEYHLNLSEYQAKLVVNYLILRLRNNGLVMQDHLESIPIGEDYKKILSNIDPIYLLNIAKMIYTKISANYKKEQGNSLLDPHSYISGLKALKVNYLVLKAHGDSLSANDYLKLLLAGLIPELQAIHPDDLLHRAVKIYDSLDDQYKKEQGDKLLDPRKKYIKPID